MIFTEIFQNQMLKVKIWHVLKPGHHSILKDTEVSLKTNFVSQDLKLQTIYHHNPYSQIYFFFWFSSIGDKIINTTRSIKIRSDTKYEETIGIKREWIHPLRATISNCKGIISPAYYDLAILELGTKCCKYSEKMVTYYCQLGYGVSNLAWSYQ